MSHRDFRSLTKGVQAELRHLAFTHLDAGLSRTTVAMIVEVNPQTTGAGGEESFLITSSGFRPI